MKEKKIVVRCSFLEHGPTAEELIRESFRVYLQRELWSRTGEAGPIPDPGDDGPAAG